MKKKEKKNFGILSGLFAGDLAKVCVVSIIADALGTISKTLESKLVEI